MLLVELTGSVTARGHSQVIRQAFGGPRRFPLSGPNVGAMRLEGIQIGDIVGIDRLGRLHARVTANTSGGLSIQPQDRRIS